MPQTFLLSVNSCWHPLHQAMSYLCCCCSSTFSRISHKSNNMVCFSGYFYLYCVYIFPSYFWMVFHYMGVPHFIYSNQYKQLISITFGLLFLFLFHLFLIGLSFLLCFFKFHLSIYNVSFFTFIPVFHQFLLYLFLLSPFLDLSS